MRDGMIVEDSELDRLNVGRVHLDDIMSILDMVAQDLPYSVEDVLSAKQSLSKLLVDTESRIVMAENATDKERGE